MAETLKLIKNVLILDASDKEKNIKTKFVSSTTCYALTMNFRFFFVFGVTLKDLNNSEPTDKIKANIYVCI